MPTISCIIVSYNNAPYLKRAIDSALNQSHKLDEIIISDDGSTDSSRDIAQSFARKYPSVITLILREQNLGVSANRDLAIREAKGDLISTLDGDDYYYKDKIKHEYCTIEKGADIAFSDIVLIDNDDNILITQDLLRFPTNSKKEMISYLTSRKGPIPRDLLLPKKAFIEAGGFDHSIKIYEDWDFKIRLAALNQRWSHSGASGTAYRRTGSGLSSSRLTLHAHSQMHILLKNKNLITTHTGKTGLLIPVYNLFLKTVVNFIRQPRF